MATLAERIVEAIRHRPLDDDVLAKRLGASSRQAVNQAARKLEAAGLLRRVIGPDGKIVNSLVDGQPVPTPTPAPAVVPGPDGLLSEDEVKGAVADHLVDQGFEVEVAWGRVRGIDIDAKHPDGRRWIIEAKGAVASDQQQGNYFLGALGELVQRMDDPAASYAVALPDNRRYRRLVGRLPRLARERLGLVVFWVRREGVALSVEVGA